MRAIRTDSAPLPRGHYSQAVEAGGLLFVSGQLPLNLEGRMVNGSIADEAQQVLLNVSAIVSAAGGNARNLVQCTVYISDISLWPEVNEVYGRFFKDASVLPARAIVPVKELHHGARIEIQAIAVLG
jgi:2-iminobutanoate/2-iminopropanoate deaminase